MARCVRNERESRSVFYGAMISESRSSPSSGPPSPWPFSAGRMSRGRTAPWPQYGGQCGTGRSTSIAEHDAGSGRGRYSALLGVVAGADHIGRHGLPFGAADRRRLLGRRTAHAAEAYLHLHCRSSSPGLPHHLRAADFTDRVALFRVDQPDARARSTLWAVVAWLFATGAQLFGVALLPARRS